MANNNKRTLDYYRKALTNHISRKIISDQYILDIISDRNIDGYAKCNLVLKDDETILISVNKNYILLHNFYPFIADIDSRANKKICDEVSKRLGEEITDTNI